MDDPGRELFERLKTEQWALVEEWKDNEEAETLHLEFKLKTNPKLADIDSEDKAQVAKTLSAFGNTEGGLLVLGVDAGGGQKGGFDRVTRIEPIEDVERFGGAVERVLRTFTDPMIGGMIVQKVVQPGAAGAGVLGIYVPPSVGGPHRAINATKDVNDRYYMRTSAGAQTIPHGFLGALFSAVAPPRLELQLRVINLPVVQVELRLFNHGRGVARRPAIVIHSHFGAFLAPFDSDQKTGFILRALHTEDQKPRALLETHRDVFIYPGMDHAVLFLNATRQPESLPYSFKLEATLYALDMQPRHGKVELVIGDDDLEPGYEKVKARRLFIPAREEERQS
jgi:hypothetical protein